MENLTWNDAVSLPRAGPWGWKLKGKNSIGTYAHKQGYINTAVER